MAELLIHNAHIISFHKGAWLQNANAMLVSGNQIAAIGTAEELQSQVHSNTHILNAGGKTILPGLNDTHIHVWKVGNLQTFMLDLRGVKSLDELLSKLDDYSKKFPEAPWVTARGFNEAIWEQPRIPTRKDLDKVIPGKPVYMIRTCAHIAVANTKALELSGITHKTMIPEGGIMHLDEAGQPNGIFAETALGLVSKNIPAYTKAQLKIMVQAAREELYRYGITAVTDPAVDPELLGAYHEMNADGSLGIRLNAIPMGLSDGGEISYPIPELYNSPFLTVNMVKFFSDGGLSGKTAALKRNYRNSTDRGVLRLDLKKFDERCRAAMEKGLGVATHAIGDAAIELVAIEYAQLQNDYPGLLKRVEHLGLPDENQLSELARNEVATSMQTIFINELGRNFRMYIDDQYLERCYPVRSVIDHGITVALSSDAPVVKNMNPFKGMQSAITRKDEQGFTIAGSEAITIKEAIKAYTSSAATISGIKNFGSIEQGMLADFIMVDRNPLSVDPESLENIRVEKTFVDGNCVWEHDDPVS